MLAVIATLTALVFAAWKYGNIGANVPALDKQHQQTHSLVLRGVRHGTFVVVRRNSRTGRLLFSGRLTRGRVERFTGTRFYVAARRHAGVRITPSPGVKLVRG